MTVVLDTSALLALAVDGPQRAVTLDALAADPVWAASAMASVSYTHLTLPTTPYV